MSSILDSRYRVEEEIGSGGMGRVYKAFDTRLKVPVAIKFTVPQSSEAAITFYREAELLSNLKHPALPRVIDFNKVNETQYLVMEYIEGDDLRTLLEKRQAPFNSEEVLNWALQLLNVIGYLHSQGIQHRDIKPANIKVRDNRVFLLDFGIAYGQVGEMSTFSNTNFPWNGATLEYASLEQLNGAKTTPASDIYSLAATLYLLLTGQLPTNPQTRIQEIALRKTDPLIHVSSLVSSLNQDFANAIMMGLELEPSRRPQSAEQMYQIMFPQKASRAPKAAKRRGTLFRKMAMATGLLTLLLFGVALGTSIQLLSYLNRPKPRAEEKVVTPREQAIVLTEEAVTLLQSAKYDDSIKKCSEALIKDPNYPYALFVCGDALWDTYYDDAVSNAEMTRVQEYADKILALITSPQTAEDFVARAWANLAKEKYDIAIADANKSLELKPNFVAALMIRASARSFMSNQDSLIAFEDYDKVVKLMPNYVQARANRANSYYELGKYEWAISDYTEAIRVLPVARYFNGRGNAYYALGKYQEARTEYQEALKLNSRNLSAQVNLADTYTKEEDWDNAIREYTKSISIKPTSWAYRSRGYANGELQRFDKAVKDFTEALKLDDTDYLTYFYRGSAFASKRDLRRALSDFSEAIEKAPKDNQENLAALYQYRAAVYRLLKEEEKASADEMKAQTLSK